MMIKPIKNDEIKATSVVHERIFERDHPHCGALEEFYEILYKPVVILGLTKKLLQNRGLDSKAWQGENIHDSKNQWIIYPCVADANKVILKSVSDLNNLSLWC